jgi:hypothetical protein
MTILRFFPILFLAVLLFANGRVTAQTTSEYEPSFALLRDTLYLLDTTYLEVRLDKQMIYQHYRSGRVERHLCSTGDPSIDDGIATREGIFTIQSKEKKHMSQQFQVYLNYWMPFDGGIGFHGLEGHSYYRYLGRRRSSHGCVRIANETGAALFRTTSGGTVVYVHSGSPARVIRFADESMTDLMPMKEADYALLAQRLDAVIERRWDDSSLTRRLAISARQRLTGRVGVGRIDPTATVQKPIPLIILPFTPPTVKNGIEPVPVLSVVLERTEEE